MGISGQGFVVLEARRIGMVHYTADTIDDGSELEVRGRLIGDAGVLAAAVAADAVLLENADGAHMRIKVNVDGGDVAFSASGDVESFFR